MFSEPHSASIVPLSTSSSFSSEDRHDADILSSSSSFVAEEISTISTNAAHTTDSSSQKRWSVKMPSREEYSDGSYIRNAIRMHAHSHTSRDKKSSTEQGANGSSNENSASDKNEANKIPLVRMIDKICVVFAIIVLC
jgi:hypothetical protein